MESSHYTVPIGGPPPPTGAARERRRLHSLNVQKQHTAARTRSTRHPITMPAIAPPASRFRLRDLELLALSSEVLETESESSSGSEIVCAAICSAKINATTKREAALYVFPAMFKVDDVEGGDEKNDRNVWKVSTL